MSSGGLGAVRAAVQQFERDAGAVAASGGVRLTIHDYSPDAGKGFDRIFVGLGATLDAMPDVLLEALPAIRAAHRAVFESEGSAGRGKWAPLRPATIAERVRLGFGEGPILQRTGALMAHVLTTPAIVRRIDEHTVELRIAPDPVVAGTGRPYFRAQSLGYAPNNLPARPSVAVGPRGAVSITSAISRAFRAKAAAEGV